MFGTRFGSFFSRHASLASSKSVRLGSSIAVGASLIAAFPYFSSSSASTPSDADSSHTTLAEPHPEHILPIERAVLTKAPFVPPPITRQHPVRLVVDMNASVKDLQLTSTYAYPAWTFNDDVPGPFIRARKGDMMEVHFRNDDDSGMPHNLDFHAVSGPGGGAPLLTADQGQTKKACFKLTQPGLFIYHCAVGPVAAHMANGMYGLMLVEPAEGLPKVDKEYFVVQSEYYTEEDRDDRNSRTLLFDMESLMNEIPSHVVFNGRDSALIDNPLTTNTDERLRLFVGNAGPNLVSSFHVIGAVFDKVYREGDLISPPARGIQSTLIPAGGASVLEFKTSVPGTYTMVDHSISRIEKGAVGYINVTGEPRHDIYHSDEPARPCVNCKLHP